MTQAVRRISSIDAFRALTMLLMVFVNDLVLVDHPAAWLEHAEEGQDRLGFADTIFPAFLFIVGLSIPWAIRAMRAKGLSARQTALTVLKRGFALLVMGIYTVNYEEYTTGAAAIPKHLWLLLACAAFFLIWIVYPKEWTSTRKRAFQAVGVMILVVLALIYRGGEPDAPKWMEPYWYGILGLIGWSYLIGALLYLAAGDRIIWYWVAFLVFVGLSVADNIQHIKDMLPYHDWLWFEDSGGVPAFTMAGVAVSLLYGRAMERGTLVRLLVTVPFLLMAGLFLRPIGGISKLEGTPSWVLICTGISVGCFAIIAYFTDWRGKEGWYRWIRPAGTATLTCYLLSYIHFSLYQLLATHHRLPHVLREGWAGVGKSLVFAFLIVLLTGWLEKKKIRLAV